MKRVSVVVNPILWKQQQQQQQQQKQRQNNRNNNNNNYNTHHQACNLHRKSDPTERKIKIKSSISLSAVLYSAHARLPACFPIHILRFQHALLWVGNPAKMEAGRKFIAYTSLLLEFLHRGIDRAFGAGDTAWKWASDWANTALGLVCISCPLSWHLRRRKWA